MFLPLLPLPLPIWRIGKYRWLPIFSGKTTLYALVKENCDHRHKLCPLLSKHCSVTNTHCIRRWEYSQLGLCLLFIYLTPAHKLNGVLYQVQNCKTVCLAIFWQKYICLKDTAQANREEDFAVWVVSQVNNNVLLVLWVCEGVNPPWGPMQSYPIFIFFSPTVQTVWIRRNFLESKLTTATVLQDGANFLQQTFRPKGIVGFVLKR